MILHMYTQKSNKNVSEQHILYTKVENYKFHLYLVKYIIFLCPGCTQGEAIVTAFGDLASPNYQVPSVRLYTFAYT